MIIQSFEKIVEKVQGASSAAAGKESEPEPMEVDVDPPLEGSSNLVSASSEENRVSGSKQTSSTEQSAVRSGDSSRANDSSFESDPELVELESLKKTLEARIQLRLQKVTSTEGILHKPCHSQFTDIMHKARDSCLSMQNQPPAPRTLSVAVKGPAATTATARIEVEMDQQQHQQQLERGEQREAATGDQTAGFSGQCKDWFAMHMMKVMHDMDAEDCIFQHLDLKVLEAIAKDEYVDFNKLIDRDEPEDDNINLPEGLKLYLPQAKLPFKINTFGMWCKAALVFMAAHQKYHPEKAAELIEYHSSIEGYAKTYLWHKVAEYDQKFRRNMAKKPWRHWGLVNQALVSRVFQADDESSTKAFKKDKDREKAEGDSKGGKPQKGKDATMTIAVQSVEKLHMELLTAPRSRVGLKHRKNDGAQL